MVPPRVQSSRRPAWEQLWERCGAAAYRAALAAPRVREVAADRYGCPCCERHLQAVWYDGGLRPATLTTAAGEAVEVLDPGRWNLEAGPDFLDAALRLGPVRRTVRGDVEVHIRARDWTAHGHAADPRYARVVAHVTLFDAPLPDGALPAGCLQLALGPALAADPSFSFEAMDLAAYPYDHLRAADAAASLRAWSPERRVRFLAAAGAERLRRKAERIERLLDAYGEEALYRETLAALGYKHNAAAFRRVAELLPLGMLREASEGLPARAAALLWGVAGLLPGAPGAAWDAEARAHLRALWRDWWPWQERFAGQVLPAAAWRLHGLRPHNHPRRRLVAAAALFAGGNPVAGLLASPPQGEPAAWLRGAAAALAAPAWGYWRTHATLGAAACPAAPALLGEERAQAILANLVVPAALLLHGAAAVPLLGALPRGEYNRKCREAVDLLFGRDCNPLALGDGLSRQGLLQVFEDVCLAPEPDVALRAIASLAATDFADVGEECEAGLELAGARSDDGHVAQ